MKEEMIKKYVKDLDGLLGEVKLWEKQPVWDIYHPQEILPYHDALIFVFGRLFNFFNFNSIFFGPRDGLDALVGWNDQIIDLEFEVFSKTFEREHLKNIKKDEKVLIVCWENNWKNSPNNIDIIEIDQFFKEQKL